MDRGEEVFGANWIEQWRQGLEENAFNKCAGMTPFECAENYGAAAHYGCDMWSWGWDGDATWRIRQDRLFPRWWALEGNEEDNARTRDKSPVGLMR